MHFSIIGAKKIWRMALKMRILANLLSKKPDTDGQ